MASFANYKPKIEKKIEKELEEKLPLSVPRKTGEERVNTNLKPLNSGDLTINLDNFNHYKIIAKEFNALSHSILDTMMLLNSWISHGKINVMERDAIVNYINNR